MIATIFILSFYGCLGLLYILNWNILVSIGLLFLFLGVWCFILWRDSKG